MKIGLINVDGKNYPNFALMKLSAWHKANGDSVEWAIPLFGEYDIIYASKVFTFTADFNPLCYNADRIVKGGTGYNIESQLQEEIDEFTTIDYSLYPQLPFSIQFCSRGCIRDCPFCLVRRKEGNIRPVKPVTWNPRAKWIEVLDNNFFANPNWEDAIRELKEQRMPVKLHGVDVRIMNKKQANALNDLKIKGYIHIAWDSPQVDLTSKIEEMIQYIRPDRIVCYVLVGFNSTREQDLYRLRMLKRLGVSPFVQPYRDYNNERKVTQYENDLSRWANRRWFFKATDFLDFEPRKGFHCSEYFV